MDTFQDYTHVPTREIQLAPAFLEALREVAPKRRLRGVFFWGALLLSAGLIAHPATRRLIAPKPVAADVPAAVPSAAPDALTFSVEIVPHPSAAPTASAPTIEQFVPRDGKVPSNERSHAHAGRRDHHR